MQPYGLSSGIEFILALLIFGQVNQVNSAQGRY